MNKNIFLLFLFSFNFISSLNSMISVFFKNIFSKNKKLNNQINQLNNKFSKESLPEAILIIGNKNVLANEKENYPKIINFNNRPFLQFGNNLERHVICEIEEPLVNNLTYINKANIEQKSKIYMENYIKKHNEKNNINNQDKEIKKKVQDCLFFLQCDFKKK